MKIYLAGPDVFVPDPLARAAMLKRICAAHGLLGVFPFDPVADQPASWNALPVARRIALQNEAHIADCAAVVANLTPFRGPSADPGTVFEMGYARALGRPVFGWTANAVPFTDRTLAWLGHSARRGADGVWRDGDGMAVEAFGCVDNLMLDGAIAQSGGELVIPNADKAAHALEPFERCVALAARRLGAAPGHRLGRYAAVP